MIRPNKTDEYKTSAVRKGAKLSLLELGDGLRYRELRNKSRAKHKVLTSCAWR